MVNSEINHFFSSSLIHQSEVRIDVSYHTVALDGLQYIHEVRVHGWFSPAGEIDLACSHVVQLVKERDHPVKGQGLPFCLRVHGLFAQQG